MGLSFPMTKDAEILARSHKEAADSIAEVLDSGNDVAMLNLGDITVYSTFAYVMNILLERDYDVELIPGVTSFCASASELKISLTTMNDPLHIIPATGVDLKEALALPGTKNWVLRIMFMQLKTADWKMRRFIKVWTNLIVRWDTLQLLL